MEGTTIGRFPSFGSVSTDFGEYRGAMNTQQSDTAPALSLDQQRGGNEALANSGIRGEVTSKEPSPLSRMDVQPYVMAPWALSPDRRYVTKEGLERALNTIEASQGGYQTLANAYLEYCYRRSVPQAIDPTKYKDASTNVNFVRGYADLLKGNTDADTLQRTITEDDRKKLGHPGTKFTLIVNALEEYYANGRKDKFLGINTLDDLYNFLHNIVFVLDDPLNTRNETSVTYGQYL